MLNRLKKCGVIVDLLAGSTFNADSGYDGENNYKSIFMMNMFPNIRQRINAIGTKVGTGSTERRLQRYLTYHNIITGD